MLRKSSSVSLFLLLFGMLFIQVQAASPTIPQFLDDYYEAVKEGDLTLSHNLLRYNESRLENYIKENHPEHLDKFKDIKDNALVNHIDGDFLLYEHLEIVLWLDALVNQEPLYFATEKDKLLANMEQYHNRIEAENSTSLEDIKAFWASVLPAADLALDKAFFQQFHHHYNLLSEAVEDEEIDRVLSQSIEMIQADSDKGGLRLDALLWTIIIVGGCIILTLVYVGFRKYQAEKKAVKEKQYKRDSNS